MKKYLRRTNRFKIDKAIQYKITPIATYDSFLKTREREGMDNVVILAATGK